MFFCGQINFASKLLSNSITKFDRNCTPKTLFLENLVMLIINFVDRKHLCLICCITNFYFLVVNRGGAGDAGEGQHRGVPSIYPETLPESSSQPLLSAGQFIPTTTICRSVHPNCTSICRSVHPNHYYLQVSSSQPLLSAGQFMYR